MTLHELKALSETLDLNKSVKVDKCTFVNNAEHTVKSLFATYEGAKDDKQRDRYKPYLNLIENILNKCR